MMTYPVLTGKADFARLSILNQIYNPVSFNFLKKSGLHKSIKILEIGCGYGDMALKLARHVGLKGEVIAIDQDIEQIKIAELKRQKKNISNIRFISSSLEDFSSSFVNNFDLVYMRWTLMFMKNPLKSLEIIYTLLKAKGVFVCEDVSVIGNGMFTCHNSNVGERWTEVLLKNFKALGLNIDLAGSLYGMLTQLGFNSINAQLHQPILKTKREKSVFRLGVLATQKNIIENKVISDDALNSLIKDLEGFESCNKSIIGYMRNLMISGTKENLTNQIEG